MAKFIKCHENNSLVNKCQQNTCGQASDLGIWTYLDNLREGLCTSLGAYFTSGSGAINWMTWDGSPGYKTATWSIQASFWGWTRKDTGPSPVSPTCDVNLVASKTSRRSVGSERRNSDAFLGLRCKPQDLDIQNDPPKMGFSWFMIVI
jgi:hypothetical protein